MKIGTKSLLFGVHQVILHPIFVLISWLFLYRKFPSLSELISIVVHDWGLWGLPNIDGKEGEQHPEIVAKWWWNLSDRCYVFKNFLKNVGDQVIGHSGYYAKQYDLELSKLYYPDKLSISFYPMWLYFLLGKLSGEIDEYMRISNTDGSKYSGLKNKKSLVLWFLETRSYMTFKGLGVLKHDVVGGSSK